MGDIVKQVSNQVSVQPEQEYRMAGVKWYAAGVFHRETVRGNEMSARYVTPLKPGALIYNRLFAWKESFAVVMPEHDGLFVSNEFPQFIPDPSKVLPEFLYLFCTIPTTIRLVNAASAGSAAVSRNRFKESEFTTFELRLPPLGTQRAIVAHWRSAQEKIAASSKSAEEREADNRRNFLEALGLSDLAQSSTKRAFALRWTEIERWGVDGLRKGIASIDPSKFRYNPVALGSVLDVVQYGTSEKANTEGRGTPVLRMNNVHEGILRFSNIKHVELPANERERLLLKDGDILFNRTNSKELVGKCAVFHGYEKYVYASYLIRVRTFPEIADPDYIACIINGPVGRQQIDNMSRQIIGQANVNSKELRSLQIPLPPLAIQKKLVAEVAAARECIASERAAAAKLAADTSREVEEMILGHRPPPVTKPKT